MANWATSRAQLVTSRAQPVTSRAQPVSAQNAVVWLEVLYLDSVSSPTFDVILYEKHRIRDQMIAKGTLSVSELWNKNKVSLSVIDDKNGAVCALQLTVAAVKDGDYAELDQAVAAVVGLSTETRTGGVVNQIEDAVFIGSGVVSSIGAWGPLFEKIQAVADIVGALAEVHPYTKLAWGVISAGYELAKQQKERDENVEKLIEALDTAYSLVLDTKGVQTLAATQIKTINVLTKNTITCGHFLESYLKKKGFWGRAVQGVTSSTDKDIDNFLAQFEKLQKELTSFTMIATQHQMQAILGATERIEDAVHLARMPFTTAAQWRTGRKCLPGTRQSIISQILDWAHLSSDDAPRILLLTGVAGVGKSSIANTIASELEDMSCLAASYCFDRNNVSECRPELLIPTVAHQLASSYAVYQHALASNSPSALGTPDLDDQFDKLLLKPLKEQTFAEPLFVVVDALDESGSLTSRAKLVTTLADRFVELPPQVRLILTSRPEEDILGMFGESEHVKIVYLDTDGNDKDIIAFVASKLVDRRGKPLSAFSYADYSLIAAKSEGLFQWAAVVCASITQGKNQNVRLTARQMRDTYDRFVSLRSGALDALYDETLTRLLPEPTENDQLLARTLGLIVASQQPLSATSIFEILLITEDEKDSCFAMLQGLGALLTGVFGPNEPIRTLHSSFRDYLFTNHQDQRFHVDQSLLHCDVTIGCLRVLNEKLQFNICGLETSYVANEDVTNLAQKIRDFVPPSLSYAAQFLGHHIQQAGASPWGFVHELGILLREKFLFWLELLSLLNALNVASPALHAFGSHVTAEELRDITADYRRFVRAFGQVISRAAPHIYLSAYALAPTNALIHQQLYSQHMRHLAKLNSYSHYMRHLLGTSNTLQDWTCLDMIIKAHAQKVSSVAFSPDSRRVLSGSHDKTLRIWDAETGAEAGVPLEGHTGEVASAAYSPDGCYIVSGSWDNTVRIWSAETGATVCAPLKGHTHWILSVAYSPDGRCVVSGSGDKTMRIWNAETGVAVCAPLAGHTGSIASVAYSPNGRQIVSGSWDGTVRIWDAKTGVASGAPLEGHTKAIHSVAYSPDGRYVVSGSGDKTVRIWDAKTGAKIGKPLEGHTDEIHSVAYSPDGRRIVSGSNDKTVCIWDVETRAMVGEPLESPTGPILCVAYSRNGRYVVSGSSENTVCIWDAETGTTSEALYKGHTGCIRSVAYSPDGRHIVSGSDDKTVRVWNAKTGNPVGAPCVGHTGWINCVAYSPNGQNIASGSQDCTLRTWNLKTRTASDMPSRSNAGWINAVAYSPDGRHILSGSFNGTVRVWDAETGTAAGAPLKGHTSAISSVAFTPDSLHIVSGSWDRTLRIWDARTGAPVGKPFEGHTSEIHSVACAPTENHIVSGSIDNTVRIWDSETGDAIFAPLRGHTDWIRSVAYSPNGRRIVSGSDDRTIRIWDAETGAALFSPLEGHTNVIRSVAYSPDGRHAVSGSDDRTIRIWDMQELDLPGAMRTFSPNQQHALRDYPCVQFPHYQTQLNSPPFFRLTDSGWIEDVSCSPPKLLIWIPVECRTAFYLPPTSRIIAPVPVYSLDLSNFVHGTRWTECYEDSKE